MLRTVCRSLSQIVLGSPTDQVWQGPVGSVMANESPSTMTWHGHRLLVHAHTQNCASASWDAMPCCREPPRSLSHSLRFPLEHGCCPEHCHRSQSVPIYDVAANAPTPQPSRSASDSDESVLSCGSQAAIYSCPLQVTCDSTFFSKLRDGEMCSYLMRTEHGALVCFLLYHLVWSMSWSSINAYCSVH